MMTKRHGNCHYSNHNNLISITKQNSRHTWAHMEVQMMNIKKKRIHKSYAHEYMLNAVSQ